MIKVFIDGSRKLGRLNDLIRDKLNNIIQKNYIVLVGDANGIDKAIQNYMFSKNYHNVFVYHVGKNYRNNLGNWQTKQVDEPSKIKNFQYYASKDLQVVKDTDYGLMIWDLESKGTLNNVINLLRSNKSVVVYISKLKEFYNLNTIEDLEKLLDNFESSKIRQLAEMLKLNEKTNKRQTEFNFS